MLRQCVNLHPDGTAFTYIDYERDSEGISESLTWSQVYRRTLNVAAEVRRHAAIGDRAVILAPQGLDYIVAFLGALQAGLIAVPLSAPLGGASDERVDAVVRDAKPNVVLTTSAIMGDVVPRVTPPPGIASPPTVAVDQLDLDSPIRSNIVDDSLQTTAYLQYTSGSTRTPAGVMITYKNILANFQQMISAYFRRHRSRTAIGPFHYVVATVLS